MDGKPQHGLLDLIDGRRGHFELESGHHGELWLDLHVLFLRPALLSTYLADLAEMIAQAVAPDAICGPLLGGGLVASAVATLLDVELHIAAPVAQTTSNDGLFEARYVVGDATRSRLRGRRIVVVDDVVNAGSATRATVSDLRAAGGNVVALGALIVLGTSAGDYAEEQRLRLLRVAAMPNRIWVPPECPLCVSGEPLVRPNATLPQHGPIDHERGPGDNHQL